MATEAQPVNLAKFGQNPRTARVTVSAAAANLGVTGVTNLQKLFTVPTGGCLLTKLTAMPKGAAAAIVPANSLLVYLTTDGVNFSLMDSETMAGATLSAATKVAKTTFNDYSENTPERLEGSVANPLQVWVGIQTPYTAGIDFKASYTDFAVA